MSLSSDERHFNHLLLKNKKTTTVSIFLEALKCLLWISVSRWLHDLTKLHASFIPEEFFIRNVMISRFRTRSKTKGFCSQVGETLELANTIFRASVDYGSLANFHLPIHEDHVHTA